MISLIYEPASLNPNLEFYLPLIYPQPATLLDYFPRDGLLVVDDWPEMETAVRELQEHADQIANEQPSLPPGYPDPMFELAGYERRDKLVAATDSRRGPGE